MNVEDDAEYSSNVYDAAKIVHSLLTGGDQHGARHSDLEVMYCTLLAHSLGHNIGSCVVQTREPASACYKGLVMPCIMYASVQGLLALVPAAC